MKKASIFTLMAGMALGVVFSLGIAIGSGVQYFSKSDDAQNKMQEMILRAEGSSGGKAVALATGPVGDGNEGLFALDFATGDLYCWVLNPRFGNGFRSQYVTNVKQHLKLDKAKGADYVMTVGQINNTGGGSTNNARPAASVVYVADGNTGAVAGFGFQFSPNRARQGGIVSAEMTLVCTASTRGNIQRD